MLRTAYRILLLAPAVVLLAGGIVKAQGHQWLDDPGQLGHYAIGHTGYFLTDKDNGNRPVFVGVWYPVDAKNIKYSTPPAQYPLDPYTGTTNLPVTLSTDWEPYGYDRAYEGPTPSDDGPFPLVVFSPGSSEQTWQYIYVGTRLASHGYVVALAEHWGDCQWPWDACDDPLTTMFNRPRDISFIITQLLQKSRTRGELLFRTSDPDKIAASGHSMGGYTTYALAGGDKQVCDTLWPVFFLGESLPYPTGDCVETPRDPRVKAIVLLDGSSDQALHYTEFARIEVPSLIMGQTSDQMVGMFPDMGNWSARPHSAIDRRDSYRVDVNGANHLSFDNSCDAFIHVLVDVGVFTADDATSFQNNWPCASTGWDPVTISSSDGHQVVTKYMIAFLDVYFHNPDSAPWLDSWILTPEYALTHTPTVQFFDSEDCHAVLPDHTYFRYRPYQTSSECDVAQKDPTGWFVSPSPSASDDAATPMLLTPAPASAQNGPVRRLKKPYPPLTIPH